MTAFLTEAKFTDGPRGRAANWQPTRPRAQGKEPSDIQIWRTPVQFTATRITESELIVIVNTAVPRRWMIKLLWHGTEILQWHTRPGTHRNPRGCPPSYPRTSRGHQEHEHLWHEGCDCRCVKPLPGLRTVNLEHFLHAFASRANLDIRQRVTAPIAAEQLRLP